MENPKTKQERMYITSWKDMVPFGINLLTSESCAYNLRGLFDLNDEGVKLVADYFGLHDCDSCKCNSGLATNWNSQVWLKPAVGSIMLPHSIFQPLAIFALMHVAKFRYVYVSDQRGHETKVLGVREPLREDIAAMYTSCRVNPSIDHPEQSHGGRNIHQFSGRTT